ncbi:hypothetical protein ABZ755_27765 [Streptomyces griseoincarnatus]
MIDAGLQRGSLTGTALRGDDLVRGDQVAQQTSLDTTREARLVAEAVIDRIRDKFGLGIDAGRNPPRLLNLLLKPSGREALCRFSRPDAVPPVDAPALHPGPSTSPDLQRHSRWRGEGQLYRPWISTSTHTTFQWLASAPAGSVTFIHR